ncbi:hypothetical protein CAEBREN_04575 [Caenorhabditis brenneri]|uniref:C-type lectin domain-containing protein n=1 Tax=Caenorhabditis brenneri TaxID=135651 RepID=G0M9C3_CAEBE|nr:hypothetical protein CAEBREN_04575 [Caenorhabditis brenneri]
MLLVRFVPIKSVQRQIGYFVFGASSTNLSVTCERFQPVHGSNSTEDLVTTIKTPVPTSITTTSPSVCPPGWKYTYRTPNSWCLRLVVNATLPNTYSNAKKMCADLGSQISGLFSMPETDWLKNLARSVLEEYEGTQGVYIDGTRRAACSGSNWSSLASCRLALGFEFTDPTLTNRGGYAFADGEPNGYYYNGVIQSCIQMVMTKNKVNPYFGKLDDMSCDAGYGVAAVLCGQWAKF